MKCITLNTRGDDQVTIFFNTNTLVVFKGRGGQVSVLDGVHNNGGWQVKETYEQVIEMILAA